MMNFSVERKLNVLVQLDNDYCMGVFCIQSYNYIFLLYKLEWFIDFSATNKIDNLTCVIIHDNLTCVDDHETH